MSKVKAPQEKKQLSLERDRRNMYGESPHASRKNIRRGKQNQHQEERRASNQILAAAVSNTSEDILTDIEIAADTKAKENRLLGFKKVADRSLGEFLDRQHSRRQRQGMVNQGGKNRE
jgi:hypothetical protein